MFMGQKIGSRQLLKLAHPPSVFHGEAFEDHPTE